MTTRPRATRLALAVTIMLLATAAAPSTTVSAATGNASDFADDCDDDGVVNIAGVQRYIGGSGNLSSACSVWLSDGATLVFRDVELTGAGFSTVNPFTDTTIKVIDSIVNFGAVPGVPFTGGLALDVGATAGDGAVPEFNGRVVVRGSKVVAEYISMNASFDWPDGTIVVRDSTLISTSGSIRATASHLGGGAGTIKIVRSDLLAATDIRLATGIPSFTDPGGGSFGLTKVTDSFLQATGSIEVHGSSDGRVVVRRTALTGGSVEIMTGVGGRCVSSANTPPIPCS